MINYFKNSEISIRIGLNPVGWKWIPAVAREAPTPFYPKRRTYAFAFLFLQAFLDVDDGSHNLQALQGLFGQVMNESIDEDDESQVGSSISTLSKRNSLLEQGSLD